jgi:ElaB/YqjD/DUF883 family membrane-anchored ribosome-binding protein
LVVRGHGLRIFQRAPGLEVGRNAGRPEHDLHDRAWSAGLYLQRYEEAAQQAGSHISEAATSLATQAGEKAKGVIDQQVSSGADFLKFIGRSARAAADTLDPDAPQLAGLVRGMASSVTDLSDTVRGQSPDALLETASDYIRQNPALVFSAAAACGFAVARLLREGAWNGNRSNVRRGNSETISQSNAV